MKRILLGTTALLLTATACGSATGGPGDSTTDLAPSGARIGECTVDSAAIRDAKKVADVDLDGDGKPDEVRRTSSKAKGCADYLVVDLGDRTLGAPLGGAADGVGKAGTDPLALKRTTGPAPYRAVTIPGRDGQVLVVRETHPRGLFRDHVYAADAASFVEVMADGQPVLPQVVTDTGTSALEVRCTEGGFVALEGVPHEPPGVVAAWDVRRTTFTLDGTDVTADGPTEVADNVLPDALPKTYPGLAANEAFVKGCG